jgi:hypothetical protein
MTLLAKTERYFIFAHGNRTIDIAVNDVNGDINQAFSRAISRLNEINDRFKTGEGHNK